MDATNRTAVERLDEDFHWTARQREVLGHLAARKTNAQIAEAMGLSLDGAKWHVSEVMSKLDTNSRDEAAEYWRAYNRLPLRFSRAMRAWWRPALAIAGVATALAVTSVVLLAAMGPGDGDSSRADGATATAIPTTATVTEPPATAEPAFTPTPPGMVPLVSITTHTEAGEVTLWTYRDGENVCLRMERSRLPREYLLDGCVPAAEGPPLTFSAEVMQGGVLLGVAPDSHRVELTASNGGAPIAVTDTYSAPANVNVPWQFWVVFADEWAEIRAISPGGDVESFSNPGRAGTDAYCGSHWLAPGIVPMADCAPRVLAGIAIPSHLQPGAEDRDSHYRVYADGEPCGELAARDPDWLTPQGEAVLFLGRPDQPVACSRDGAALSLVRASGAPLTEVQQLSDTYRLTLGEIVYLESFTFPPPGVTLTPVPTATPTP